MTWAEPYYTKDDWRDVAETFAYHAPKSWGELSHMLLMLGYKHNLRLTWLPRDAVMPQPPRYKKQYQRTFRGHLFPPGGPKK